MKKLIILIIIVITANYAHAQKLNQDTLAKYSKKTEQVKIFNQVAADIHLDAAQRIKFNILSTDYADKAIAIVRNSTNTSCDKLALLKQIVEAYSARVKLLLSPEQFSMLKGEREKYHFGRRFIVLND